MKLSDTKNPKTNQKNMKQKTILEMEKEIDQTPLGSGIGHIVTRAKDQIEDSEEFSKADLVSSTWWQHQEAKHRSGREQKQSAPDSFRLVRNMGEDYRE